MKTLKEKRNYIEDLFNSGRYKLILEELKEIYTVFEFFNIEKDQKWLNDKLMEFQFISIKKTILDLALRFDRLELNEIAEKTNFKDKTLVETVIKQMITNNEIYADYSETSKALLFNKEANIDEIDKLMETFRTWEKSGKKKLF